TPAYMRTTPPPADVADGGPYFERWRALVDRFIAITAEELLLRQDEWRRRRLFRTVSQLSASEPKTWLEKETFYNPFLRQLAKDTAAELKEHREAGFFGAEADREDP